MLDPLCTVRLTNRFSGPASPAAERWRSPHPREVNGGSSASVILTVFV